MSKQKQKNHIHHRNELKRSQGKKQSGRILIVTEGDSEKAYFDAVVARWKLHGVVVPKNPDGTDPRTLLENAEKYAKEGDNPRSNLKDDYDAVWVVYDLEKPNAKDRRDLSKIVVNQVRDCKKYERFHLAISDPSFEYWYILHFERTTKSFTGAGEAEKHLKEEHWHSYRKGLVPYKDLERVFGHILDKTPTAIENAERIREQLLSSNSKEPMTDVDLLWTYTDKDSEIPSLYEMCFGQRTDKR